MVEGGLVRAASILIFPAYPRDIFVLRESMMAVCEKPTIELGPQETHKETQFLSAPFVWLRIWFLYQQ
jgi:hypothetical protein